VQDEVSRSEMGRILGFVSSIAITGIILYGLIAESSISFGQPLRFIYAYAGIITIALILITSRIYLPIQTLESFVPKPKRDVIVMFLVGLQLIYFCMNVYADLAYFKTLWSKYTLPQIVICIALIPIVWGYIRGMRWAWALVFLFSIYILHEAILLKNEWNWLVDSNSLIPRWIALLEVFASSLCLRFLASTTKTHSINGLVFTRVLGAVAIVVGIIYARAVYFSLWSYWLRDLIWDLIGGYVTWGFIVGESALQPWMILALLWTCYAGICLASWIYMQTVSSIKKVGQV
jgi:hypothetical protein